MIILTSTDSLEIFLAAAAVTQADYSLSCVDATSTTYTPVSFQGTSNDTTAVVAISSPSVNTYRQVKFMSFYNKDTSEMLLTVQKKTSGTAYRLCKIYLQPDQVLQYVDGQGFSVIDAQGDRLIGKNNEFNISAGTQLGVSDTVSFSNVNGFSFGFSSNTLTATYIGLTSSFYDVPWADFNANGVQTAWSMASQNMSLQRISIPYVINVTRLDLLAHISAGAGGSFTCSVNVGLYSNDGTNLYIVSSTSSGLICNNTGVSNNFTFDGSTAQASYAAVSGTRWRSFPCQTWSVTPGDYFFGVALAATTAGATMNLTFFGQSSGVVGFLPGLQDEYNFLGINGIYTRNIPTLPPVIGANAIAWAHTAISGSVNRQPYFRMLGT